MLEHRTPNCTRALKHAYTNGNNFQKCLSRCNNRSFCSNIRTNECSAYSRPYITKNIGFFKLGFSPPIRVMSRGIMTNNREPEIKVTPSGHLLIDDELNITVCGLGNSQTVTLYTELEEDGKKFESWCWFTANSHGVVDLHRQASEFGTYTGVSPMGLFWSMGPAPGLMKGIRMMKKNMDTPFRNVVHVYEGHLSADDIRTKKTSPLHTRVIERWYKGPGVTSHDITDGRIRGKLFLPAGPGPFPGIIDLFGTVGGLTEFRSSLLASRGFASLALPYFLYKDLPNNLCELDLDYFLEAVDWMLSHNKVYSEGVGVVGVSKGGDIALLMGANCPKVRAIVNINGCTFNASIPMKYSGGDVPEISLRFDKFKEIDGVYAMCDSLDYCENDITPVWNNDAKVLNILSEDDMCSPKECIRMLKRLYPKDKTDNCIIAAYPGAGHLMEPPYTPLCNMSYHKSFGMYFWWGGQPKPHADAQEDSWRRILNFLREHIPKTSTRPPSKL